MINTNTPPQHLLKLQRYAAKKLFMNFQICALDIVYLFIHLNYFFTFEIY